jgi:acyl carrier protein
VDIYRNCFSEVFKTDPAEIGSDLVYGRTAAWDSLGHMCLVVALEDAFGVMFETDDILSFRSYDDGLTILAKHGVELGE